MELVHGETGTQWDWSVPNTKMYVTAKVTFCVPVLFPVAGPCEQYTVGLDGTQRWDPLVQNDGTDW